MKKKYSTQQLKKKLYGKCFFCGENNYLLLDVHRILPGEEGGTYDKQGRNTLVCCAGCHRKVTVGYIKVDKKYLQTDGKWIVHYWEGQKEYWRPEEIFVT